MVGTIGGVVSKEGISETYIYIDEDYRYKVIGSKLLGLFTQDQKFIHVYYLILSTEFKIIMEVPNHLWIINQG